MCSISMCEHNTLLATKTVLQNVGYKTLILVKLCAHFNPGNYNNIYPEYAAACDFCSEQEDILCVVWRGYCDNLANCVCSK
jgi:hypothetical protein